MTVHGAYTGVLRDGLQTVFDQHAERFPGIAEGAFYRSNLSRTQAMSNASVLTTQVMSSVPVYLREGETVTDATLIAATTAANTPTNQWVALYDPSGNLVAQTPDLEDDAWSANTAKTFAFAAPVLIQTTGWYRVAVMVKATAPPTLVGVTLHNAVVSNAVVADELKLAATSGSSLTDTAPSTIGTLTGIAGVPLVILT